MERLQRRMTELSERLERMSSLAATRETRVRAACLHGTKQALATHPNHQRPRCCARVGASQGHGPIPPARARSQTIVRR
jgi:hypothetical protein